MSIVSLSEFKANAAQMLAEMKSSERVVVLTRRGAAQPALSYKTLSRTSACRTRYRC